MTTEIINNVDRITDETNNSSDVEMLLAPEKSNHQGSVSPGIDGSERSPTVASQHHFQYMYPIFQHLASNTSPSITLTPTSAATLHSSNRSRLYQHHPQQHQHHHHQSTTSSSPSSSSLVPPKSSESESDISTAPSSPSILSPPTTPSISNQNSSILVRTISNGSTFGPISNWTLNLLTQSITSSDNVTGNSDTSQHQTSGGVFGSAFSASATNNPIISSTQSGRVNLTSKYLSSSASHATSTTSATSGNTSSILAPSPVQTSLPTLELPVMFGDNYLLTSQIEASNLYQCLDTKTMEEYCCKVVLSKNYQDFLSGHVRMDGHSGINQVQRIIVGRVHTFILFAPSYGDLHSYVRTKRKLLESEAMPLFKQVVQIVADCHSNGIILRDLKLRKFIFSNKERTQLKLETLEGASLLDNDDDTLSDKHGCPAYVSPEILYSSSYSGMAADCWSLGVILFTMLFGKYPFHDSNPTYVFCKIRRGIYIIPPEASKHAKCLIRSLIRSEPEHRLSADDALAHRWFASVRCPSTTSSIIPRRNVQSHHHHHHRHHHHNHHHHQHHNPQQQHHSPSHSDHSHHQVFGSHSPLITTATSSSLRISSPCCVNAASSNSLDDQVVPDLTID